MTGHLPKEIDVTTLNPRGAWTWLSSLTQELMTQQGIDFSAAWSTAKSLNSELAAKAALSHTPGATVASVGQFADSGSLIPGPTAPLPYAERRNGRAPWLASSLFPRKSVSLPNAANITLLGLPDNATWEEFRAADLANAGASPRNSAAILDALISLMVDSGLSQSAATDAARAKYPALLSQPEAPAARPVGTIGQRDESHRASGSFVARVRAVLIGKGALAADASDDEILPALARMKFSPGA